MAILGAILGDIAGSYLEEHRGADLDWKNYKLFQENCQFTDDTVMTLAIKKAIDEQLPLKETMQAVGREHPFCGYGKTFFYWIHCDEPKPYNSFGNGAAMRVSYIGEHFEKLTDVKKWARESALVSHNHPEGVKGAVTTAVCVWMAKHGKSKEEILDYCNEQYPKEQYKYAATHDMQWFRKNYGWEISCQNCVPVAIRCFYEANSYEEFLRNVISLPADVDTLGAIGGGIAEEYFKTTGFDTARIIETYLTSDLKEILYGRNSFSIF